MAETLVLFLSLNLLILSISGTPLSGFLHTQCSSPAPNQPQFDLVAYQSNVQDTALNILQQGDQSDHCCYYNSSAGEAPLTVHAFALCRGDIGNDECNGCLKLLFREQLSFSDPNRTCAGKGETEGIIWYAECVFRYANRPIPDGFEASPAYNWSDSDQISPYLEPVEYTALKNLSSALAKEAQAGEYGERFAAGEAAAGGSSSTVYAAVQCTPDLGGDDCGACLAEAFGRTAPCCVGTQGVVLLPSCFLMYDSGRFYNASSAAPYPQLKSIPSSWSTSGAGKTVIICGMGSATAAALLTFICTFCCLRYQRSPRINLEVCSILSSHEEEDDYHAFQFPYETIRSATDDFHHRLGKGGFGPVYKGKLPNGQEIAVKKLSQKSAQGDREFGNEVRLLAKMQHRNLVKLHGFSLKNKDRLLVYEYLPSRSLDFYLFDPIKRATLDWGKRYKIIRGIARGIMYLHEDSRLKIIHCDLKASNILLDEKMNAKISDFGLAKLFEIDQSYKLTDRFAGTFGYAAPEYAIEGLVSTKSDVYSFGIMVLEIITGRRNTKFKADEKSDSLISYVWNNWNEKTPLHIIDPVLLTDGSMQYEIKRCIQIALLCVQEKAKERPAMTEVVAMLGNCVIELKGPSQPAFIFSSSSSATAEQFIQILKLAEFAKSEGNQEKHTIDIKSF